MIDLGINKRKNANNPSKEYKLPANAHTISDTFCFTGVTVQNENGNKKFATTFETIATLKTEPLFKSLMKLINVDSTVDKAAVISSHIDKLIVDSGIEDLPSYLSEQLVKSQGPHVKQSIYTWVFLDEVRQDPVKVKSFVLSDTIDGVKSGVVIHFSDDKQTNINTLGLEAGIKTILRGKVDVFDTYFMEMSPPQLKNRLDSHQYRRINHLFRFTEPHKSQIINVFTRVGTTDLRGRPNAKNRMKPKGHRFLSVNGETASLIPKPSQSKDSMQNMDIDHVQHNFRIVITGEGEHRQYHFEPDVSNDLRSELIQLILDYQQEEYVPSVETGLDSMSNQNQAQSLDSTVHGSEIDNANKAEILKKVPEAVGDLDMDLSFIDDIVSEVHVPDPRQGEQNDFHQSSSLPRTSPVDQNPPIDFMMITENSDVDQNIDTILCLDLL